MDEIDDLVRTIIGWSPSSKGTVIKIPLPRPKHVGRGPDLEVVVGQLNNGLLFASVQTHDGHEVSTIDSYDVDNANELTHGYRLINLTTNRVNSRHVTSVTFQYKTGKIPNGNDAAVIEYTTRHYSGEASGLSKLVSLYASQEVENGRVDVNLNAANHDPRDPSLRMKISCSDEIYAGFDFGSEGNLLKTPRALFISERHPLYRLYRDLTNDQMVDPLKTAVSLVHGFPTKRPLHIEELVICQPSQYQPRLL